MSTNPAAVVLSGGNSTRMGEDKGLVTLNGKPLIEYTLNLIQILKLNPVIIVANKNEEKYNSYGYPVIKDIYEHKGPVGGIHAGLSFIDSSKAFVFSCDMPNLTADLCNYLLQFMENQQVVIPVEKSGRLQPMCAIYDRSVLGVLEDSLIKGKLKLHDLINDSDLDVRKVLVHEKIDFFHPDLFNNINSPNDLLKQSGINQQKQA